jgi:hypothetical protein
MFHVQNILMDYHFYKCHIPSIDINFHNNHQCNRNTYLNSYIYLFFVTKETLTMQIANQCIIFCVITTVPIFTTGSRISRIAITIIRCYTCTYFMLTSNTYQKMNRLVYLHSYNYHNTKLYIESQNNLYYTHMYRLQYMYHGSRIQQD